MNKQTKTLILLFLFISTLITLSLLINDLFFHEVIISKDYHYEPKVYITKYGECYHNEFCSYIETKFETGLYKAQNKGYKKCSHCYGTPNDTILISELYLSESNDYFNSFIISFSLTNFLFETIKIIINTKYKKSISEN